MRSLAVSTARSPLTREPARFDLRSRVRLCASTLRSSAKPRASTGRTGSLLGFTLLCVGSSAGCDVFDDSLEMRVAGQPSQSSAECVRHADCSVASDSPSACVLPEGRCVPLKSEDCSTITGTLIKANAPDAIIIGSLFSITGPQAMTNLVRQQSAMLAVEEINRAGGIPGASGAGMGRPLVMVSCDEAVDLRRAGGHLVNELKVPALVGPNTSQDTLDLSSEISVKGGTAVLTPTGVASSIADLDDNGLTWLMVPSDLQRAPLMRQQIGELEEQLREQRMKPLIKLSVIYRDDALGLGTRDSLTSLTLNGKPLADASNLNINVKFDPYAIDGSDSDRITNAQASFAPDIVVIAGTAESIPLIMAPLEQRWPALAPRPYYLLIDSGKLAELLALAAQSEDLRTRVRGTGIVPTRESQPVYDAFRVDFAARYPGSPTTISGMAPSYDAAFAIAFALAATRDRPVSGKSVAAGLRKLSGGEMEIEVRGTNVLAAMTQLSAGRSIEAIGSFAPLKWNEQGAPLGGSVEMWCIGRNGAQLSFGSSGLTLDLESQTFSGEYKPCE
jgi:ABC-type branched-subunit amino acid transport system substrate-binding protein